MAGSGVGADSFRAEVFEYGGVAEVRVEFSPGGVRSNESWSLTISGSGEVTSGSGPLRPPVLVDEVDTVSLDDGTGAPQPSHSRPPRERRPSALHRRDHTTSDNPPSMPTV